MGDEYFLEDDQSDERKRRRARVDGIARIILSERKMPSSKGIDMDPNEDLKTIALRIEPHERAAFDLYVSRLRAIAAESNPVRYCVLVERVRIALQDLLCISTDFLYHYCFQQAMIAFGALPDPEHSFESIEANRHDWLYWQHQPIGTVLACWHCNWAASKQTFFVRPVAKDEYGTVLDVGYTEYAIDIYWCDRCAQGPAHNHPRLLDSKQYTDANRISRWR